MAATIKPRSLDELQEIARAVTRKELEAYIIPEEYRHNLTLGVSFEDDTRIFELYVPGDKPTDAKVISRTTIDLSGREYRVEVFGLARKHAEEN